MAVQRIPADSRLQGRYQIGTTTEGNPVFRTRVLARVNPESTDEALMTIATIISGLQVHPLAEVRLTANSKLVEE